MAGLDYQIRMSAETTGVDASADQVQRLADQITGATSVSTQFDNALAAAKSQLEAASAAANAAASAHQSASTKYDQLEVAANRAAQAVERAAAKGRDTTSLAAAADQAKSAMASQAAVVDDLKKKADSAAASQKKLAESYKTIESAAKNAAKQQDKGGATLEETTALAKGALGPMGGVYEKATLVAKGIGKGGWTGAVLLATVASIAFTAAVIGGVFALAKMAVELNKGAMEKLGKITKTVKENFAALFKGVHVDKFVLAFESVTKLLDENTSSARALRSIIETVLNPLFDATTGLAPILSALFKGLIYGAVIAAIYVVRLSKWLDGLVPDALKGKIDWLKTAFYAGAIAMGAVVVVSAALIAISVVLVTIIGLACVVVGVLMVASFVSLLLVVGLIVVMLGVLVAIVAVVIATMLVMAAILLAPVIAIVLLIVYLDEIIAYLGQLGSAAMSAAGDLISGLVNGITSGAGAVYDAIRGLASGAIDTLKSTLGIASPSKVFALAGSFTAQGFVEGVEGEQGSVNTALETMAEPPDMQRQRKALAAGAGAGSRGGDTYQIHIHAPGGDADVISAKVEQVLQRIAERTLASMGEEAPAT